MSFAMAPTSSSLQAKTCFLENRISLILRALNGRGSSSTSTTNSRYLSQCLIYIFPGHCTLTYSYPMMRTTPQNHKSQAYKCLKQISENDGVQIPTVGLTGTLMQVSSFLKGCLTHPFYTVCICSHFFDAVHVRIVTKNCLRLLIWFVQAYWRI